MVWALASAGYTGSQLSSGLAYVKQGQRELAELTGASAGCRCGRLCWMLGAHLSERSARGQIRLAEPASRNPGWQGGFPDAEKPCSKGLGSPKTTEPCFGWVAVLASLSRQELRLTMGARRLVPPREGRRGFLLAG